jgi:ferric-dicitrate binding protein FerR (iron transport regulator)
MRPEDRHRFNEYFKSETKDDEDFITQVFSENSNDKSIKRLSRNHWDQISNEKLELRHILKKIHRHIQKKQTGTYSGQLLIWYNRAAAILLIPILITSIYLGITNYHSNQLYSEIRAPKGSKVQFQLPDGSNGYLNGGSSLSYASNFKTNRQVKLSGEAFFEVEKDKMHPFRVETESATIEVLGTRFDVCAYKGDNKMYTTLEEGKVQIINKQSNQTVLLHPGEQNSINQSNGEMSTNRVNTQLYTSWKEEILKTDNTPFAEVVKLMERWYGVNIQLDPNLKYSQTYTLTIKTESLREMLQLLKITTPFNYQINGNKVLITDASN